MSYMCACGRSSSCLCELLPVTADVQRELAEALTDDVLVPIERGPVIAALLPTVQALIERAEKRAAAAALRDAADGIRRRAAGMSFAPKVHAQHEARLLDRSADALDPSGAALSAKGHNHTRFTNDSGVTWSSCPQFCPVAIRAALQGEEGRP